jgi:glycosyltransferase involved in cell wall biosynthesis
VILLDAVFINNSGGKVLLDYLVPELFERHPGAFFLLDERVKESFQFLPPARVKFIRNSLLDRHDFYKKNFNKFSSVLCFGNVPPSVRLKAKVYTYFHNSVLFYTSSDFPFKVALGYKIKSLIIRFLKSNTDFWYVQTPYMKDEMQLHWNINSDKILVIPFFKSLPFPNLEERSLHEYYFISDGHPNKMHSNLLDAFKIAHQNNPFISLNLTISPQYPDLIKKVETLKNEGIVVKNLGWCTPDQLKTIYSTGGFLIFPSSQESFGLGLIEAAQYGMKVIASDLPFVHEVIEPSLTFDPWSINSIAEAIETSINKTLPVTRLKIKNQILDLLEILDS